MPGLRLRPGAGIDGSQRRRLEHLPGNQNTVSGRSHGVDRS